MFEAQYLFAGDEVFSPWMPRGGDNMIVTVDLIASNSSNVTVEVYQKNSEDTGDGFIHPSENSTPPGTPTEIDTSTLGPTSETFENVMELVRYKISASGSGTNRILFRMLSIVWYDEVKA